MTKRLLVSILFFLAGAGLFFEPSGAFAGIEQAEAAFLKGDYAVSIKNCEQIINSKSAKSGEIANAYYLKARSLIKEDKAGEAGEIFQKIISRFSTSQFADRAQFGMGDVLFCQGNFSGAIGEYRKVTEQYPRSQLLAITLYRLAKSCLELGRMEEARFYFQKLQQDYPLSFESKLIDELDDSEFIYSVQAGCFGKYDNAERFVKKLKGQGFDAYISEKEGYPVFYRVRIGRYKTLSEARACSAMLEKKGHKTKICP